MTGRRYHREALLRAAAFRHIQRDFLAVILWEEYYTMAAARAAVAAVLGGDRTSKKRRGV